MISEVRFLKASYCGSSRVEIDKIVLGNDSRFFDAHQGIKLEKTLRKEGAFREKIKLSRENELIYGYHEYSIYRNTQTFFIPVEYWEFPEEYKDFLKIHLKILNFKDGDFNDIRKEAYLWLLDLHPKISNKLASIVLRVDIRTISKWKPGNFKRKLIKKADTKRIVELHNSGKSRREIIDELNLPSYKIDYQLNKLKRQGGQNMIINRVF